ESLVSSEEYYHVYSRVRTHVGVPRLVDREEGITPPNSEQPFPSIYLKVRELGAILTDLKELLNGEEQDEDGILRPTSQAFSLATKMLIDASHMLIFDCRSQGQGFLFPRGDASTDSEGGIRVEWSKKSCSVRLVVAASDTGKSYIYYEFPEGFGSDRKPTAHTL